ncbi:MAG: DedA family protein [Campylobacteraceae bacterium]|nr:DedA family protein [Campylobacteraceae bacterium]
MEELLKGLMLEYHEYVYIFLFIWCLIEGELGLVFAGIMAHQGLMSIPVASVVASFGAFLGDQFYFSVGRYNKKFITKKLNSQKRKFAIAHLLLQRYGWPIIFFQRFIYGFRAIIPMSIGITRYDARKFAIINIISCLAWSLVVIYTAWYFGEEIWDFIAWIEKRWYIAIPVIVLFFGLIIYGFKSLENKFLNKKGKE